jgi:hypothetical protein
VLLKRTAPRLPVWPEQAAAAAAAARGHAPRTGQLAGLGLGLMAKVADFGLSLTLGPADTHVSQMHMVSVGAAGLIMAQACLHCSYGSLYMRSGVKCCGCWSCNDYGLYLMHVCPDVCLSLTLGPADTHVSQMHMVSAGAAWPHHGARVCLQVTVTKSEHCYVGVFDVARV